VNTSAVSKSKPVLLYLSILAGLDVLTAGAAFGDVVTVKTAGIILLMLAAVKAATAFYLQSLVVPLGNVLAYQPDLQTGTIISGGASVAQTGATLSPLIPVGRLITGSALPSA
jgi:hypothetical protein